MTLVFMIPLLANTERSILPTRKYNITSQLAYIHSKSSPHIEILVDVYNFTLRLGNKCGSVAEAQNQHRGA
jgi:hypothetical protein